MEGNVVLRALLSAAEDGDAVHSQEICSRSVTSALDTLFGAPRPDLWAALKASDRSSCQVVQSCGHVFQPGELIYHCRDCAIDQTCVLCSACFQPSDHDGHRISYHPSRGMGGSCDCGEGESWRAPLHCPRHCEPAAAGDPGHSQKFAQILAHVGDLFAQLAQAIAALLVRAQQTSPLPGSPVAVVLYNDERHSFPQVIDVVTGALRCTGSHAKLVADAVDSQVVRGRGTATYLQGFHLLKVYPKSGPESARVISTIGWIGLAVVEQSPHSVLLQMIANAAIKWQYELADECPSLRRAIVCGWTLEPAAADRLASPPPPARNASDSAAAPSTASPCSLVFSLDNALWKYFRKTFQSILTLGLAFQQVKIGLLSCFMEHTEKLVCELIGPTREAHLSILHFAVQVLTVPSIAQLACERMFPRHFTLLLQKITRRFLLEASPEWSLRRFYEAVVLLFQIIRYVTNDQSVQEKKLLGDFLSGVGIAESFVYVQGSFKVTRKVGDHVLYESSSWIHEVNLTLHTIKFLLDYCECFTGLQDLERSLPRKLEFISDHLLHSPYLHHPEWRYNEVSFQQPLLWLTGGLLERRSRLSKQQEELAPFPVPFEIARGAIINLSLLAQIKAGLWIRNGIAIAGQASVHGISTNYLWLYFSICMHAFGTADPATVCEQIDGDFFTSCMLRWPANQEPFEELPSHYAVIYAQLIHWLLSIFAGSFRGMCRGQIVRVSLVHALAMGPGSYSDLCKRLQDWVTEDADFENILASVSVFKEAGSPLSDGLYELDPRCSSDYTPHFWIYSEQERESSLEFMQRRMLFSRSSLLRKMVPGLTHFSSFFAAPPTRKLLKDLLVLMLIHKTLRKNVENLVYLLEIATRASAASGVCASDMFDLDASQQAALKSIYDTASRLVQEQLLFIIPRLFPGLDLSSFAEAEVEARTAAANSNKDRIKKVMESMRASQKKFMQSNEDALAVIDDSLNLEENFEMVESGTCIICQEPAGKDANPYGILCHLETIQIKRVAEHPKIKTPKEHSFSKVLTSCHHLIHEKCYHVLATTLSRERICPLCNFAFSTLIPVVVRPTPASHCADFLKATEGLDLVDGLREFVGENAESLAVVFPDPNPKVSLSQQNSRNLEMIFSRSVAEGLVESMATLCYQAIQLENSPTDLTHIYRSASITRALLCATVSRGSYWESGDYELHGIMESLRDQSGPKDSAQGLKTLIALVTQKYPPFRIQSKQLQEIIFLSRILVFHQIADHVALFDPSATGAPNGGKFLISLPSLELTGGEPDLSHLTPAQKKMVVPYETKLLIIEQSVESVKFVCRAILQFLKFWISTEEGTGTGIGIEDVDPNNWHHVLVSFADPCPSGSTQEIFMWILSKFSSVKEGFRELSGRRSASVSVLPATFFTPPDDLSGYYSGSFTKKCRICQRGSDCAICFKCGTVVCLRGYCGEGRAGMGGCNTHMSTCGGTQSVYFIPQRCAALLLVPGAAKIVAAPYVDQHGESDLGFERGGPLKLSRPKYEFFKRLWLTGGVRAFIFRNLDSREMDPDSL